MEWTIETTHPRAECTVCDSLVDPAIQFATDNGFTAYGHEEEDANGTLHGVNVRQVPA